MKKPSPINQRFSLPGWVILYRRHSRLFKSNKEDENLEIFAIMWVGCSNTYKDNKGDYKWKIKTIKPERKSRKEVRKSLIQK